MKKNTNFYHNNYHKKYSKYDKYDNFNNIYLNRPDAFLNKKIPIDDNLIIVENIEITPTSNNFNQKYETEDNTYTTITEAENKYTKTDKVENEYIKTDKTENEYIKTNKTENEYIKTNKTENEYINISENTDNKEEINNSNENEENKIYTIKPIIDDPRSLFESNENKMLIGDQKINIEKENIDTQMKNVYQLNTQFEKDCELSPELLLFNIKLIGKIEQNKKLAYDDQNKKFSIDSSYVPSISRYYNGDNRSKCLENMNTIFELSFRYIDKIYNLAICTNNITGALNENCTEIIQKYLLALRDAGNGLEKLKQTYCDDMSMVTGVQLLVDKINAKIEKINNNMKINNK